MVFVRAGHDTEVTEMVETETVADSPCEKVVGAGLVAADPNRANFNAACFIQCKPAGFVLISSAPLCARIDRGVAGHRLITC